MGRAALTYRIRGNARARRAPYPCRVPTRASLSILVAVAFALPLAGCGDGDLERNGAVQATNVRLRQGSMPRPPPVGEPLDVRVLDSLGGWESVTLPHPWDLRRRARGVEGWYRADLVLPPDRRDWAIHLDGSWHDLDLFADGARIGALTRDGPPPTGQHLWNATLLVPLPERGDRIELVAHFRTSPGEIGALIEAVAGPREWIDARARNRTLLRSTIPSALGLVGLAGGLMVLLLARYAQERGTYLFGLATTSWCLFAVVPTQPETLAGWLASVVSHAFVPVVAFGLHRLLDLSRPRVEWLLAGSVLLGAALRAAVPALFIPAIDVLWWIGNFFIGIYLLPLAILAERRRATSGARWFVFAGAVLLVAGLHDVASIFLRRMLFTPYSLFAAASPIIAIATAGSIVASLLASLRRARALNAELEDRVEEKRRELQASYARTAELERERAIATERERMMRDMHDGTGGQLVSALSLVEGGEFRPEDLAETLRAALADLRLSIDSLETGPADLLAVLALARTRLEGRLEHHGVRFAWEVEDVPTPPGFGAEQSLHVLRIFQEAVTNALKHAKAKVVTVRTGLATDAEQRRCALVEIADDGRGLDAVSDAPGSGRGLRNMRRRAEEIGARCTVTSDAAGTTVRLLLPLG